MAYRALYRQYRPQSFSEVIGQEHITTTLKNQVSSGRISHAYLFCGTRGTGKTTTARILARAANCLSSTDGEACGRCAACMSIGENSGDIIEIDAASNNGVDDVRTLIESANYAPIQLKRRMFIIDEVHMLSSSAFNALLKTLEEPPAHIVFILATTEPQKLPATIISRCQRFDFRRHTVKNIARTLQSVLASAGMFIEEEGLMIIARIAEGSMRDALSLCDQCLAFCGEHVSVRDICDVLGSVEESVLFNIADNLIEGDADSALRVLSDIFGSGRDLTVFTSDLARHFRSLLIAKICGDCASLLECTPDAMQGYLNQAMGISEAHLLLALEILLSTLAKMRYQALPRTLLESALVRICKPEDSRSLTGLEARIAKLEAIAAKAAFETKSKLSVPKAEAPIVTATPVLPKRAELPTETHAKIVLSGSDQRSTEPINTMEKPALILDAASKTEMDINDYSPVQEPTDAATTLWQAVLADVQKSNVMVFMMAQAGTVLSLDSSTLSIGFSDANESQFQSVSAAINQSILQAALESKSPGLRLRLIKTRISPTDDEVSVRAREIFGDTLVIE